ncbi:MULTISPECIES: HNH/ENDO VII family nuclease [unclassified Halomonas]|uniref:HNH/ENDO VII family nuclease n=1 Tax=unclassified Halomonas TaxID=2609666 RepID=UPI0005FCCEE3|nr:MULTISPECIES: HNH/ENDO VII family nuclease [unclassified Halomonas]CEP34090.1 Putative uncharacterized protein [Halomonas sp. R57-5]
MIEIIKKIAFDNIEHCAYTTKKDEFSSIENFSNSLENVVNQTIEKPDIQFIECTSRAALIEQHAISRLEFSISSHEEISESDVTAKERLSDEEKAIIKEETNWSDDIIENIQNMKQYDILKNGALKEVEINDRKCLIKVKIELDKTDADGISNRDRIIRGLAPLDSKTGKPLELHHLGQKADSPLVELTAEEHRTGEYEGGKKNQSLWHDNTLETEVHGEGSTWDQERKAHWKSRSEQSSGGNE